MSSKLIKLFSIFAVVVSISACSSNKPGKSAATAANTGNPIISDNGVNGENLEPFTPIPGSRTGAKAGDRVFFDYDSSAISPVAEKTLERQAGWLTKHSDIRISVEGHADERGTREYNLALGARRANAAKNQLVKLGVSAARISTVSFGKERPAVTGSDPESWAENRRAVTVLIDRR